MTEGGVRGDPSGICHVSQFRHLAEGHWGRGIFSEMVPPEGRSALLFSLPS